MTLFSTLLLVACSPLLEDPSFPTGSSPLAVARDGGSVISVDADSGLVVRLNASTGDVLGQVDVGGEPSRVAPIGSTGRYAVTSRATRSVTIVEASGAGLEIVVSAVVGAEPVGIVSNEEGTRLYVACSTEHRVLELDASSLAVLRAFDVPGQPRWLALKPGSGALYAMPAYGRVPRWIDLASGEVHSFEMPARNGFFGPLTVRLTGDPAVSADGQYLVMPSLYLDNMTEEAANTLGQSQYYSMFGKWNPVIVTVPLSSVGQPRTHSADVISVTANLSEGPLGSYPTSVTLDPAGGSMAYVTMEGVDAIVAMVGRSDGFATEQLATEPMTLRRTGHGPNGIALTADNAWVHTALDHTVQPVALRGLRESVAQAARQDSFLTTSVDTLDDGFIVTEPTFSPEIEQGRRLFTSADSPDMSTPGSGVSCATCHFEGRNDGLTWSLASGPRQTPSLVGRLSETLPVTWTSEVESVEGEVMLTSVGRMGGLGVLESEQHAIAAYLEGNRTPDVPMKGSADPAIARGKALFDSAEVGCASCHTGPAYTNRRGHDLYGLRGVDTPTLRGIAATAPYVHDGRFATLSEVLEDGRMGNTSQLSAGELADLEAYLRSL